MNKSQAKTEQRERRKKRIRAKIFGTVVSPRLSVFKSNKYISAQLIDDASGVTLVASHSQHLKNEKGSGLEKAKAVGLDIATKAKVKKIKKAVFDRGGFSYTGKIKAVADGAREGGLEF